MEGHPDHPDWMSVRFRAEALEEFGVAFPEMPPGDELVLWIKMAPCDVCGKEPEEDAFGAIDPEYVTDEGLLVGRQLCEDCLQEEVEGVVG